MNPKLPVPSRIKILDRSDEELYFVLFWRSQQALKYFWILPWVICIGVLVPTILGLALGSMSTGMLFAIPLGGLPLLWLVYRIVQALFNRTIITISLEDEEVRVLRVPLHLQAKQNIPLWSISKVWLEENEKEKSQILVLETSTGKIQLPETFDREHSLFIKTQLEEMLGDSRSIELPPLPEADEETGD